MECDWSSDVCSSDLLIAFGRPTFSSKSQTVNM